MKKITELIERYCCQYKDLEPLKEAGRAYRLPYAEWNFVKCRYCDQVYEYYTFVDAAGSTDWNYRPVGEAL